MDWTIRSRSQPQRVLLLASKFDHGLADLLYRWRIGELAMEPVGVVSNHPPVTYARLDFGDIPFHHLPVSAATKAAQERRIRDILDETNANLVALPPTMQILYDALAVILEGRRIHTHTSSLPCSQTAYPPHSTHSPSTQQLPT